MRPHTEGPARGDAKRARRLPGSGSRGWQGGVTGAVLAVLLVVGVLTASTAGWAASRPQTAWESHADTAAVGDRRCLTRDEESCLDEPVPADEPHEAICSTCHNLWDRVTPEESARSCAGSDCHENPEKLNDFHGTVHAGTLENCVGCHDPHDAVLEGGSEDCVQCHEDGGARVAWAGGEHLHLIPADLDFNHPNHQAVDCNQCHAPGGGHGDVLVTPEEDCLSCHHESDVAAELTSDCADCHQPAELNGRTLVVERRLDIQVGTLDRPLRRLPFDHAKHTDENCAECHDAGGGLLPAADSDCSSCHMDHHTADSNCYSCHLPIKENAHDVTTHLGCVGSGCHTQVPAGIERVPRTRAMCLSCHTDQADHEPARNCADCHRLPRVRIPPGR